MAVLYQNQNPVKRMPNQVSNQPNQYGENLIPFRWGSEGDKHSERPTLWPASQSEGSCNASVSKCRQAPSGVNLLHFTAPWGLQGVDKMQQQLHSYRWRFLLCTPLTPTKQINHTNWNKLPLTPHKTMHTHSCSLELIWMPHTEELAFTLNTIIHTVSLLFHPCNHARLSSVNLSYHQSSVPPSMLLLICQSKWLAHFMSEKVPEFPVMLTFSTMHA